MTVTRRMSRRTLVYMSKSTRLSLKIFFDKTHENVKDFLPKDC